MTRNVTVVRHNDKLKATDEKLVELQERWHKIGIQDHGNWTNQSLHYTRQLYSMLHLARVITIGALQRNESRGAHYKPEFPERDDETFMKTTIARYQPSSSLNAATPFGAPKDQGSPSFTYEPIDVSLVKPRARKYDVDKSTSGQTASEKK
jgi:succinate dehydrogenase / fumarate reductase flavoprotein subunit